MARRLTTSLLLAVFICAASFDCVAPFAALTCSCADRTASFVTIDVCGQGQPCSGGAHLDAAALAGADVAPAPVKRAASRHYHAVQAISAEPGSIDKPPEQPS